MDMCDTCYVREGTYHETVTALSAGHISIEAFPGETVALDGTDTLSDYWVSVIIAYTPSYR